MYLTELYHGSVAAIGEHTFGTKPIVLPCVNRNYKRMMDFKTTKIKFIIGIFLNSKSDVFYQPMGKNRIAHVCAVKPNCIDTGHLLCLLFF